MSHPRERLSAFLDGELPVSELSEVESHVRACPECAREIEDLSAVDTMARGLAVEAPAGYFDTLPARVRARVRRPRRWGPMAAWAAAAAAVLVVVVTPLTLDRAASTPPARSLPVQAEPAPVAKSQADAPASTMAPVAAPAANAAAGASAARRQADEQAQGGEEQARAKQEVSSRLVARDRVEAPKLAKKEAPAASEADRGRRDTADTLAFGESTTATPAPPAAAAPAAPAFAPPPPTAGAGTATAAVPSPSADKVVTGAAAEPDAEGGARPAGTRTAGLAGSRERKPPTPGRAYATTDPARLADERYQSLLDQRPATAADARALRDGWEAFARDQASGPRADEARVRAVEAGATAWRLGGDAADLARVRAAARTYLAAESAPQRERVRAALEGLPPE